MPAVGLDVREAALAAVCVGDDGRVVRRASRPRPDADAVADLVRELFADGPVPVGLAARDPRDPAVAALAAAAAGASAGAVPRLVTRGGAAVLAEQWCGAARGAAHVVALCADEGIQAGLLVGGRLLEGAHGLAGSAGWLALNPVERDDYRRQGCLEAEVGAAGIVRRLVWRVRAGDDSRVVALAGGQVGDITVRHVFESARTGDGVAIAVVRDTVRYIGMAIGNLVATLDPEVVVLCGLIADADALLVEPSRAEAARRLSPDAAAHVRIVPGALGDDAPAIGAARAAMLER